MKEEFQFQAPSAASDPSVPPQLIFEHPNEVLLDPDLTPAERRAILASWASDLHAVEGLPQVRQLENGTRICLKDALRALRALDERGLKVIDQVGGPISPEDLSGINAPKRRLRYFSKCETVGGSNGKS